MIEPTINRQERTAPYLPIVNTEYPILTDIDTTELGNEISSRQKASYVEHQNKAPIDLTRPQLTPPTVSVDVTATSIDDIFKQFEKIFKGISLVELMPILEAILGKNDERWQAFDKAVGQLIKAQSDLDYAITALETLAADPDTPQYMIDNAKEAIKEAFDNLAKAMEKLLASVAELPPSADTRRLQQLLGVHPYIDFLDQLLLRMHDIQQEFMLGVPQRSFDFYKALQDAIKEMLKKTADEIKKKQDEAGVVSTVVQVTVAAISTAFIFFSAGTLSFVLGALSAILMALDFALDGVIAENVFNPIMDNTIGPLIEKMITGLTEVMKKAGCPEEAAIAVSTVFSMVGLAVGGIAAGKLVSAGVGALAEKEFVKQTILIIETKLAQLWTAFETAVPWLAAIPAAVAKFDKWIIEIIAGTLDNYIHLLSQAQLGIMTIGTATEMSLQITSGFIEMAMKEFEGLSADLTARDDVVAKQFDAMADNVKAYVQDKNRYQEMRGELWNSYRAAMRGVTRA